jgi:hypothetical protein
MKPKYLTFAALLLAGSTLSFTASAFTPNNNHSNNHHGPISGTPHFMFTHHDFGHFTPDEHLNWTGGHWNHAWHNGRFGWWWFAGGLWYFYDAPIYPYPGYVSDYYADDDQPGPGYQQGPAWYYCSNPPGYYPYVQNCGTPWQPVPATPPPPPPGPGYGPPPGAANMPPTGGMPGSQAPGYGPGGQPPMGYQGPDNGPPDDLPPPGYQDQGPGPGDQPPPPPAGNNAPSGGYNGPGGPNGSN